MKREKNQKKLMWLYQSPRSILYNKLLNNILMTSQVGKGSPLCVRLDFVDLKIDLTDFKHGTDIKVRK
jgi:hypothetical protein